MFGVRVDFYLFLEYSSDIRAPRGVLKNTIMKSFISGLQTEFQKITWPTWAEAFGHAVLVIVIAIIIGYYLGFLDAAMSAGLKLIIK